jgi:hypothetical protein
MVEYLAYFSLSLKTSETEVKITTTKKNYILRKTIAFIASDFKAFSYFFLAFYFSFILSVFFFFCSLQLTCIYYLPWLAEDTDI